MFVPFDELSNIYRRLPQSFDTPKLNEWLNACRRHCELWQRNGMKMKIDTPDGHFVRTSFHFSSTKKNEMIFGHVLPCMPSILLHTQRCASRHVTERVHHPFCSYSLNKKEWICSLFKEWILERMKLSWIWSEHLCYSLFLEWPQGSLRDSEWSLRSLQNEWIVNNTNVHSKFTPNSL